MLTLLKTLPNFSQPEASGSYKVSIRPLIEEKSIPADIKPEIKDVTVLASP
jgi:hypothetical protein